VKARILYGLLFVVLSACSNAVELEPIPLGPLFHDSNSKIWMIDQVIVDNRNFAPKINLQKDVLVFYANGKCMFQPMRTLGDFVGKKGEYTVYSDEKSLTLYFEKEKWDFKITTLTPDKIILEPTKASDLNYKMVLVPFPEF